MNLDIGPHVADDVLESYLLHRLTETETVTVEEHLLACQFCQIQAEETEAFILAAKAALREPGRKPAMRAARTGGSGATLSWFSAPVIITASLGLAIGTYLQPRPLTQPATPAQVSLSAMRGADFALPHIHASNRLILNLDTRDLPSDGPYEVQVVNSAGTEIWTGTPQREGDQLRANVSRRLSPGHYWIRLSRATELVREYGLAIE
jgi:hypothetical protein